MNKVNKKPLFVATMYDKNFFIMYTDKKAVKHNKEQDKKENEQ